MDSAFDLINGLVSLEGEDIGRPLTSYKLESTRLLWCHNISSPRLPSGNSSSSSSPSSWLWSFWLHFKICVRSRSTFVRLLRPNTLHLVPSCSKSVLPAKRGGKLARPIQLGKRWLQLERPSGFLTSFWAGWLAAALFFAFFALLVCSATKRPAGLGGFGES